MNRDEYYCNDRKKNIGKINIGIINLKSSLITSKITSGQQCKTAI